MVLMRFGTSPQSKGHCNLVQPDYRLFLINSPVVRGDNLRFREAGVKEVISRVLLPWLNSFRFFMGSVALLKKEHNIDFTYDGSAAQSTNVMDRWLLARCQSLIQHVGQEMAGACGVQLWYLSC